MKLKQLKLNQLSREDLNNRQMKSLKGGNSCGCGCHYANEPGGASTFDNQNANSASGYASYGGSSLCWEWDPVRAKQVQITPIN